MYMAVTTDEYELPLAVEDTASALAKHFDMTSNDVYSAISKGLSCKAKGFRFIKVVVDDECF